MKSLAINLRLFHFSIHFQADPWICGHRGHSTTSCGYHFSRYFEKAAEAKENGIDSGCIFWNGQQTP